MLGMLHLPLLDICDFNTELSELKWLNAIYPIFFQFELYDAELCKFLEWQTFHSSAEVYGF